MTSSCMYFHLCNFLELVINSLISYHFIIESYMKYIFQIYGPPKSPEPINETYYESNVKSNRNVYHPPREIPSSLPPIQPNGKQMCKWN